ncbi:MAG: tetratricopeptide repeat protein [Firmicutes bacterium]|nr:tetratricopeptide repeat protein [Bacillota bacterium]
MKKHNLFIFSLFLIIIAAQNAAPTHEAALKITGILFACSYLLFYAGDIAVFRYKLLARKAMKENRPEVVKEYYRQIGLISPGSLNGKAARGIVHALDGEWEHAEKLFREVLRQRPHDFLLHYNLAVALLKRGFLDEAMKSLLLIIRLRPHFAHAYSAIGEIEIARGNDEAAYCYFQYALLLDRNDPSARMHLPILRVKLEQAA